LKKKNFDDEANNRRSKKSAARGKRTHFLFEWLLGGGEEVREKSKPNIEGFER